MSSRLFEPCLPVTQREALNAIKRAQFLLGLDADAVRLLHIIVELADPYDRQYKKAVTIRLTDKRLAELTNQPASLVLKLLDQLSAEKLLGARFSKTIRHNPDGTPVHLCQLDISPLYIRTVELEWLLESVNFPEYEVAAFQEREFSGDDMGSGLTQYVSKSSPTSGTASVPRISLFSKFMKLFDTRERHKVPAQVLFQTGTVPTNSNLPVVEEQPVLSGEDWDQAMGTIIEDIMLISAGNVKPQAETDTECPTLALWLESAVLPLQHPKRNHAYRDKDTDSRVLALQRRMTRRHFLQQYKSNVPGNMVKWFQLGFS